MDPAANREDFANDLRDKYAKVQELLGKCNDPKLASSETTLERKNEAIEILKSMQIKIEDALNNDDDRDEKLVAMLAIIWLDIGVLAIDNEEPKTGEENFMRCVEALAGRETSDTGILPTLSALNQLGIIWFHWGEPAKAKTFLKQSEKFYKQYKSMKNVKPVAMASLFGSTSQDDQDSEKILETLHTLTLYYLGQILSAEKNHQKGAEYFHMTLRRQLDQDDTDTIEWALNAATLSQFFMKIENYSQARHHLAAASHILSEHEKTLGEPPEDGSASDDVAAANWERYRHRSADVARCWAKFGLLLMSESRNRLIQLSSNSDDEEITKITEERTNEKNEIFEKMKFLNLEEKLKNVEHQITSNYLLDFNDARDVFLNVKHWLDEAVKYYNYDSHASDHVQIIGDLSQAYKNLSFFEDDEERQAKMHKRRIDVLETVANELNPRYYQSECRQMWIELGEIYSAILNIKLDRLRANDERATPQAIAKINNLARSSIKYYQKFLDSFKETKDESTIVKFTEDNVKPALYAYFHLGTLWNKIITTDKNLQLDNVKKSIEAYKFFVDYCETSEELAESMKSELVVCKELVNLLPLKMNKLVQSMSKD